MSKRRRKPGRLYWLWTFAVGIYSPRKGQRRIAADRAADHERISELENENARLRDDKSLLMEKNSDLVAENNDLRARLEIADAAEQVAEMKTAATKIADTMPLRRVNTPWGTTDPGVIHTGVVDLQGETTRQPSKVS